MDSLLRNLDFDRISFWLGFLGGMLFWWLLSRLRPLFSQALQSLRRSAQLARESRTAGIEGQFRTATLLKAQQLHLASVLFSLDEILIPPKLICPPAETSSGEPSLTPDIAEQVVPYMPDWSEIRITFGAPTMTLLEALEADVDLVVLGGVGSGKTVSLAHLAIQLARQSEIPIYLKNRLPLLIYAANLLTPTTGDQSPLQSLTASLILEYPGLKGSKIEPYLHTILSQGRALLLLDGLDELPGDARNRALEWLSRILNAYPHTRCVTTASYENFSGLPALGFVPLGIAPWGDHQRKEWLRHWSDAWERLIIGPAPVTDPVDALLLGVWLVNDQTPLTPLELTLKTWSVYAGDNLGPTACQAIEAYIRRMCSKEPKLRLILEKIAQQIVKDGNLFFTPEEAQACISDLETMPLPAKVETTNKSKSEPAQAVPITMSHLLPMMIDTGLLSALADQQYYFRNPAILSYLAAGRNSSNHSRQTTWSISTQMNYYLAGRAEVKEEVNELLQSEQEPMYSSLLVASRMLRYAPENTPWCDQLIRHVFALLQSDYQPLSLRARLLTALATSNHPGVGALCRQLLQSNYTNVRLLGVLGCAQLRDAKAIPELARLMSDPTPMVRQAVCLALVSIDNQNSLDLVAEALLHGDENLRRWSAEALANHPEEGHPTLQDGSTIDDFLVRKAVISGLRRLNAPWATEILKKMQVEDSQWVVKNAAVQALEELAGQKPRLPRKLPSLSDLPWLIAFAGERGVGIAPGKPAQDLLLLALKEGTEEQKLAALDYIGQKADSSAVLRIYELLYSDQGDLREAAYNTLWHIVGSGMKLPPPAEFGLGYTLGKML